MSNTRPFEIGLFTFGETTAGRGAHTESFPLFATTSASTPADAGRDPDALRVGVTSHFYVEPTSQGARDTFYPGRSAP